MFLCRGRPEGDSGDDESSSSTMISFTIRHTCMKDVLKVEDGYFFSFATDCMVSAEQYVNASTDMFVLCAVLSWHASARLCACSLTI
eukprot:m.1639816 g.1639816  ORF g.1639816 m.1639816 type:complete len:87 (-) comp38024_c0_seq1:241-501(-)